MDKTLRFYFFAFLLLCGLTQSAQAQDFLLNRKEPQGPTAEEVYDQLPPDEQMRLIDEATRVENYCNNTSLFASLHDCRCITAEFWSERILHYDPNISPIAVADRVADKCPNEPGTAGFAYERCTGYYGSQMKFGLEEFCTCYANTFAEFYMLDPRAYMPNITNIGSRSTRTCSKKGLPSPLAGSPNSAL